jgi:SAM-dependent methyltransferase
MTSDHVSINRAAWDADAPNWIERGRRAWADEPSWGIWAAPESELRLLPEDLDGKDAVELGCGTGYGSAWLARRGAKVVGLDNSGAQLRTAAMLQEEFGLRFPLVHADAEHLPFADDSFDIAISEYGAAIWCDPYAWIPEAARVLRPSGHLRFVTGGVIQMLCYPTDDDAAPADERLHRDFFGMHRFEWHDATGTVDGVEYHLGHGEMIRLLHRCGFELEDLREVRAPEHRVADVAADVAWEWARRWPSVEAWKARRR